MKPVMMVKAHVPSEKKVKDGFENPGDSADDSAKNFEKKSNEAAN